MAQAGDSAQVPYPIADQFTMSRFNSHFAQNGTVAASTPEPVKKAPHAPSNHHHPRREIATASPSNPAISNCAGYANHQKPVNENAVHSAIATTGKRRLKNAATETNGRR